MQSKAITPLMAAALVAQGERAEHRSVKYSERTIKEIARNTRYDKTRVARQKAFNHQESSRKRNRK
jgi:hypothetical protein